jgi:phenylalanyl-tRNA synthetase alpha chain
MSLMEQIDSVRNDFLAELEIFCKNLNELDNLKSKYLGRKGLISDLFNKITQAEIRDRPVLGKELNSLKSDLSKLLQKKKAEG